MADLKLKTGERVRNINNLSDRRGWVGVVVAERTDIKMVSDSCYHVRFDNGTIQSYSKSHSSRFLERVDEGFRYYKIGKWNITRDAYKDLVDFVKCGNTVKDAVVYFGFNNSNQFIDELRNFMYSRGDLSGKCLTKRQDAKVAEYALRYGPCLTKHALDLSHLETLVSGCSLVNTVHDEIQFTPIKRRTLKKVRRNVINGKTQDDYVREMGHARGVQQFNTRCLGRSTGQAMRIVGEAMCNPGVPIRWEDVDHAISDYGVPRHSANKLFQHTLWDVIGKREGFTMHKGDCTITFNPIVTEETYVERN